MFLSFWVLPGMDSRFSVFIYGALRSSEVNIYTAEISISCTVISVVFRMSSLYSQLEGGKRSVRSIYCISAFRNVN